MQIGSLIIANRIFPAPLAGVTDYPVRALCCRLSAMIAGDPNVTVAEYDTLERALAAIDKFFQALDQVAT